RVQPRLLSVFSVPQWWVLLFRFRRFRRSCGIPPPPYSSQVIPDWRRLQQVHPRSSQIGVGFSDQASIGVWFRAFPLCPQPALSDPGLAKEKSNGCPLWLNVLGFLAKS